MTVSQLFLYPVKSLSGISVDNANMTKRGFRFDRRWMVVNNENLFMSQRDYPEMATIKVAIENDKLRLFTNNERTGVCVPLEPKERKNLKKAKVWQSECEVVYGFEEANKWLSKQLSTSCEIVYMPEQTHRPVTSELVPENTIVSFADGYPYLVIGTASLDDLNGRLKEAIGIERFRPNIVVQTETAFEEDAWKRFQLGNVDFSGVKPCSRCQMINVNPKTAIVENQPLRTLAKYRMEETKIKFGLNALWSGGKDKLSVGDKFLS
ncbi:MAG: MOSC domain-containing protein [Saprospiraceae bacterium]